MGPSWKVPFTGPIPSRSLGTPRTIGPCSGSASHNSRGPWLHWPTRPQARANRVAIIQHPSGMLKQVALHHNLVTYADDSRLQYLTDTLPVWVTRVR